MKKEIESFKARNGNSGFSQKDMLMYLVEKVDNNDTVLNKKIDAVYDKLSKGAVKIGRNREGIKNLKYMFGGWMEMDDAGTACTLR